MNLENPASKDDLVISNNNGFTLEVIHDLGDAVLLAEELLKFLHQFTVAWVCAGDLFDNQIISLPVEHVILEDSVVRDVRQAHELLIPAFDVSRREILMVGHSDLAVVFEILRSIRVIEGEVGLPVRVI